MVSSHPSGVGISLDGEPAGITPKVFSLEPGSYLVEFEKEGYESARQLMDLDGGDSPPLKVDLKRLGGSVEFLSVPSGAAVFVDGKLRGSTPVRVKLPVGRYRFMIQKAGYEPFQSSFSLKLGAHSRKRVVLAPGQGPPMGVIEVRTIPPGALVTVDGQRVGGPTPTSFQITVGAHTMEVRKRGFRPACQNLEVPADGAIAVNVKMERAQ